MPRGRVPPESSLLSWLPQSSGWSCQGFHGPLLLSNTAASFPSQRHPGGIRWECLTKRHSGTGEEGPPKWRHPHHCHCGPTMVRQIIIIGGNIPWLAPFEVGFMMGDGDPEALDVLLPQVYLPFDPLPSELVGLLSVSLNEVVQLSSDPSTVPLEIG